MTTKEPRKVFFTMVHVPGGVKRIGNAYSSRKAAQEWTPFLSAAWHGARVSVRSCLIVFDEDGRPDAKTRKRLDKEFNLEA